MTHWLTGMLLLCITVMGTAVKETVAEAPASEQIGIIACSVTIATFALLPIMDLMVMVGKLSETLKQWQV